MLAVQTASGAVAGAAQHHGFWGSLGASLHHFADAIMRFLKPFGVWGLAGLALFDSALLPLPVPLDGIIAGYVAADRARFVLYAFAAAVASALGSLLPYYVGRLGGELFLLKKINRSRYERLRDRFERQEFLAIMLPAMGPPPTPIKLFEFSAGVFEMKPVTFLLAMFTGKFIQFLFFAGMTYLYGPAAIHLLTSGVRRHAYGLLMVLGLLTLAVAVWIVRKIFDRRRGTPLPIEEAETVGPAELSRTIVEE